MSRFPTTATRSHDLAGVEAILAAATQAPTGWRQAPDLLRDLEGSLRALSAEWVELAALAAPTIAARCRRRPVMSTSTETGLSREQEVQLISALHDLAGALTRAARASRECRSVVEPLVERRRLMAGDPVAS